MCSNLSVWFADGKGFQPKMYLDQLLLKKSLTDLMEKEGEMTSSIRSLDSSMQTLVYENYNKFIGATDTIRKVGLLSQSFMNSWMLYYLSL